jgi:hypothetical protein
MSAKKGYSFLLIGTMSTAAMLDQIVTQTYVNLLIKTCRELDQNINPSKGEITYDYENETYLFSGFTEEEMRLLKLVNEYLNTGKAA